MQGVRFELYRPRGEAFVWKEGIPTQSISSQLSVKKFGTLAPTQEIRWLGLKAGSRSEDS